MKLKDLFLKTRNQPQTSRSGRTQRPKPRQKPGLVSQIFYYGQVGKRELKLFAVVALCFLVAGWFPKQISEKWRRNKKAQVERRVLEHAGIVAAHFSRELQRIRSEVGVIVEQTMVPQSPDVSAFQSDPVIRQVSLWQGNSKEGLRRIITLNNSKPIAGAVSEPPPVANDSSLEERLVTRILERPMLFTRAISKEGKTYGIMALALPYWNKRYGRDAVAVASIDMKFFYLPIPTPEPPTYFLFFGKNLIYGFESTAPEQQAAEKVVIENESSRSQGSFFQQEGVTGKVAVATEPIGGTEFQVVATEEYENGGMGAGIEILIFLALSALFGWTFLAIYYSRTGRVPTLVKQMVLSVQRGQFLGAGEPHGNGNVLPPGASPSLCRAVVLHSGVHHLNRLIEQSPPHEVFVLMNDFFNIGKNHVLESGGFFEKYGESSFTAYWVGDHEESAKKAMACALSIRSDLVALNESRKIDGSSLLWAGLGLHVGTVAMGEVMPTHEHHLSAVGEVVNCARALMHLSADAGLTLLISHELYLLVRTVYQSQMVGERRLTQDTGVTKCYSVTGYLNSGELVPQEPIPPSPMAAMNQEGTKFGTMILNTHQSRWTVNNGSQMVGPYDEGKIAQMLFSQEIDFENECWSEKDGRRSTIAESGIFKGSEDPQAKYWVYDLKTIHGPLTSAFVLAATTHGALPAKSWVCEKSSINGWTPLQEFIKTINGQSQKSPSKNEAA